MYARTHDYISSHCYVLSSQFKPVQWITKPPTLLADWEVADFVCSNRWQNRNNLSIIWISLYQLIHGCSQVSGLLGVWFIHARFWTTVCYLPGRGVSHELLTAVIYHIGL